MDWKQTIPAEHRDFFDATDITGAEAETLTGGSIADSLHVHDTAGISDNAITGLKLSSSCVTTDKINTAAVTNQKIANGAVTTSKIGALAVDNGHIGTNAAIARSKLAEDSLARYQVSLMADCRLENGNVISTATTAFRIVQGAWSTGGLHLKGDIAADSGTETDTLSFEFVLPPEYVDGSNTELNISAAWARDVDPPTTHTIDAQVRELTDAGAVGADLCTDEMQTLTESFADYPFTINGEGLVSGDRLQVFVQTVIVAPAGGQTAWSKIASIEMQLNVKG